ncbi:hypothetical protein [Haloferula sp. BvORR071]|uniref:hypothetical protein n=1 Tax=Haloferula sp. BvORR071 TaxID=1396141 RepID=UPI0005518104|nr:hypothetical protein [Haloferula sp. BvORR071]
MSNSPEQRTQGQRRSISRLKIGLAILIPLVVLALAARPAYRAFRENRIKGLIESGEEAMRLEDWQAAREKSRAALMMRNGDYRSLNIYVRSLAKTDDPAAFLGAVSLIKHPEATRQDQLDALEILAMHGPAAIALSAYRYLDKGEPKLHDAELNAAITPLLLIMGKEGIASARQGLLEFMPAAPSPRVRLALIEAIAAGGYAADVPIARQHFAALISEGAPESLKALELLGNTPGGLAPGDPLPNLQNWISHQAGAKVIHHLLALHPQIAENPVGKEAIFASAINRFSSLDPAATATWLNLHNRPEDALKILEEPAKQRSDAYIVRLHSLLKLKRENDLTEALKNPPPAADPVELEIVRATLAKNRGDRGAANTSWNAALEQALYDTRRNRFIEVARAAELQGELIPAADAWFAAVRTGFGQLPVYAALARPISILYRQGRAEDILAMSQSMLRLEPRNTDLINNTAYLGLILHSTEPVEVIRTLEEVRSKEPEKVELNATLILADLLAGDAQKATSRLPEIESTKRVGPETKAMLRALALKLSGEEQKARELYDGIDKSGFLPQEKTVFANLMDGKKEKKETTPDTSLADWEKKRTDISSAEVPAWRKGLERAEQNGKKGGLGMEQLPELRVPGYEATNQTFEDQSVTKNPKIR